MRRNPHLTDIYQCQQEIQALESQLQEQAMQISTKDARIFQLEEKINQMESREKINIINTQETVPQCIQERLKESNNQIEQLRQQLRQRQLYAEEIQRGLEERDSAISCLREGLSSKEKEMGSLLESVSNEMAFQQKSIQNMNEEIDSLRGQCGRWESQLRKKEKEADELKRECQQKTIALQQNAVMLYQKIAQFQNLINVKQHQMEEKQLAKQQARGELCLSEKNREHMTNLVHYLKAQLVQFEQEIGKADQQKRQMDGFIKRLQSKIADSQNIIREYRFKVRSLEEDDKLMREEIAEMKEMAQKQEQEINDLCSLKLKNHIRIKQAEKDIIKLQNNLNQNNRELSEFRSKLQDFQRQKNQILSHLNHKQNEIKDLQQSMTHKNRIIGEQSQKIQEFVVNMEYIDKKMQQDSLIKIFMGKQSENKFNSLESIIKQKQRKINDLSGKIIQREVQASRKIEKLKRQLQQQYYLKKSLKELSSVKQKLQAEVVRLKQENAVKDKTVQCYRVESVSLKSTIGESQQTLILMEKQLKSKDQQQLQLKKIIDGLRVQINNLKDQIQGLNAEISSSTIEFAKIKEKEATIKEQHQELKLNNEELNNQKEALVCKLGAASRQIVRLQQQIKQLYQITQNQTQYISGMLHKLELCDDTDQFEILDQEKFAVIDSRESRVRELVQQIDDFRSSVAAISGK